MSIKAQVFVPGSYVPLSKFDCCGCNKEMQVLHVEPEILKYIHKTEQEVFIAASDETGIEFLKPAGIDMEKGLVYFTAEKECVFTAVSETFKNSLPVVTHWDKTLHGGWGGFCPGASDAPGLLDVDLDKGEITSELPIIDTDPSSPYQYLTGRYNLLSSRAKDGHFKVPGYERYIGEGFSLMKVTDLLAVWLSDKVLQETGYPLVYLNYPQYGLKQELPAFQIVNSCIAAVDPDHPSLATYIIPPYWRQKPEKPYPVLFTGFYDNNENFYRISGIHFIHSLWKGIKETNHPAIGVLWNGGGALGTRTYHLSAYHNISAVFDTARSEFAADTTKIIAMGGSRGAITALAAAGNPYHDNYRIKYVAAFNPILKFGDKEVGMMNPTCPMIYAVACDDTGYKYAWKKEWRDPETGLSGERLLLHNLIGSMDRNVANEVLSPLSYIFARNMKERGTGVFLYTGTHDAFNTKDSIIDLAENLLAQGVETHLQIGYRYGHNGVDNPFERVADLLKKLLQDEEVSFKGMSHYKRASAKPEEWPKSEEFFPARQPVFFEGPKMIALEDRAMINIVGAEGMSYHLKLYKLDDPAWVEKGEPVKLDSGYTLSQGVFPQKTKHLENRISYVKSYMELDSAFLPGFYIFELWYLPEGSAEWIQVPSHRVPQPGVEAKPVLQVVKEYPDLSGTDLGNSLSAMSLGWGLCEV